MSKNIEDVLILVQARLGSTRVPQKMIREFAGSTLVDILFEKLTKSKVIPKENIWLSAYEDELKTIADKWGINIYHRSKESAYEESQMKVIFEWYNKLPYKYVILVSACNPLLKIETIDNFIQTFLESDRPGAFAVIEKKTYYWGSDGNTITDWGGSRVMNTKFVKPIFEAAHCLYASPMDIIEDGLLMDTEYPPRPELFVMDELEAFDIDYEWQFNVGETLYNTLIVEDT